MTTQSQPRPPHEHVRGSGTAGAFFYLIAIGAKNRMEFSIGDCGFWQKVLPAAVLRTVLKHPFARLKSDRTPAGSVSRIHCFARSASRPVNNWTYPLIVKPLIVKIPDPVRLMDRQSDDARRLRADVFPVNALLDKSGRVLFIVTGPEPAKVASLLRLARAPPE